MWRKELNPLLAEERNLLKEEKLLKKMLKLIRSQRNSLQIEKLHLESMKSAALKTPTSSQSKNTTEVSMSHNRKNPEPVDKYLKEMDAPEQCNTKSLDLSIVNALDLILEGDNVESEQDSEEDSE